MERQLSEIKQKISQENKTIEDLESAILALEEQAKKIENRLVNDHIIFRLFPFIKTNFSFDNSALYDIKPPDDKPLNEEKKQRRSSLLLLPALLSLLFIFGLSTHALLQ